MYIGQKVRIKIDGNPQGEIINVIKPGEIFPVDRGRIYVVRFFSERYGKEWTACFCGWELEPIIITPLEGINYGTNLGGSATDEIRGGLCSDAAPKASRRN